MQNLRGCSRPRHTGSMHPQIKALCRFPVPRRRTNPPFFFLYYQPNSVFTTVRCSRQHRLRARLIVKVVQCLPRFGGCIKGDEILCKKTVSRRLLPFDHEAPGDTVPCLHCQLTPSLGDGFLCLDVENECIGHDNRPVSMCILHVFVSPWANHVRAVRSIRSRSATILH